MNKYKYASLLFGMLVLFAVFSGQNDKNTGKIAKKPVKAEKKTYFQPLSYINDTVYVTEEYINGSQKNQAAGLFIPSKNIIKVRYYVPAEDSKQVLSFCEQNNNTRRLTLRHETEHARKAVLFKTNRFCSPFVRGKMAAMNEIVAPAAEIVEAMDYHYETGKVFKSVRVNIAQADSEIVAIMKKNNMSWPVNFSNSEISDVVLKYAQTAFLRSVNRGFYKKTIRKEYDKDKDSEYIPNTECLGYLRFYWFVPEIDIWDGVWILESRSGMHNVFGCATNAARQELINRVDSLVKNVVFDRQK